MKNNKTKCVEESAHEWEVIKDGASLPTIYEKCARCDTYRKIDDGKYIYLNDNSEEK